MTLDPFQDFPGWSRLFPVFFAITLALILSTTSVLASDAKPETAKVDPDVSAGPVRLLLPPRIYAVAGVEMNIYFDNVALMLNPANYAFDVTCGLGKQQAERWTAVPKEEQIGHYGFQLDVYDQENHRIARAKTIIEVIPADAGANKEVSMLIIGDSLTAASIYPAQLRERCLAAGNPKLTLVGSYGPGGVPGEVRHEGYGGWTAERFSVHFTKTARTGDYRERGSPFLYEGEDGKPELNFKRYCDDVNGGKFPDFVTIFLGCNDTFSCTDENIDERIDSMMSHMNRLTTMIQSSSPETRIGIMLTVPPDSSQDSFGSNYGNNQTRWQYKRNQHRVVERMLERYQIDESTTSKEDQPVPVQIIPTIVNLDCVANYPLVTVPRNSATDVTITRSNNGVHPAAAGYRQIGDTLYCWLKAELSRE